MNLIYIHIFNLPLREIFYKITVFVNLFGLWFLFLFTYQIYSEDKMKKCPVIILTGSYLVLLIVIISFGRISINTSLHWYPNWSFFTLLAIFFLILFHLFLPNLYFSIKVLKKFQFEELRRRWSFFIYGSSGGIWIIVASFFAYSTNSLIIINSFGVLSLISLLFLYFLYHGIIQTI